LIAVVLICAALITAVWLVRRQGGGLHLGRGVSIRLVEDGPDTQVLGVSPTGSVWHLGTIPAEDVARVARMQSLGAGASVVEVQAGPWSLLCTVSRLGEIRPLRAPRRTEGGILPDAHPGDR